jgi:rod shape determining protein RodA
MILFILISIINLKALLHYTYVFYAIIIISLLLVLFFGNYVNGSRRWFLMGSLKFQPSEFAKFISILAIAKYCSASNVQLSKLRYLIPALLIILTPFFLINLQPDLGTSLTFAAISIPILFWAGMPFFYIFAAFSLFISFILSYDIFLFLVIISLFIIILYFFKVSPLAKIIIISLYIIGGYTSPIVWNDVLKPHQRARIVSMFNTSDIKGASYQVHQSKIAIGSGGTDGKGFMRGTQVHLGLVPEVHTDLVICIIAEEFGFIGVLVVICLFLLIILRLIFLASQMRTVFSGTVLIGIATLLIYHVFENMGMAIGIMPVTGLPIPFVSYGGSSLISSFTMMGFASYLIARKFEY